MVVPLYFVYTIIGEDDSRCKKFEEKYGEKVIFYSMKDTAEKRATKLEEKSESKKFFVGEIHIDMDA
jgi:hypothetical protein